MGYCGGHDYDPDDWLLAGRGGGAGCAVNSVRLVEVTYVYGGGLAGNGVNSGAVSAGTSLAVAVTGTAKVDGGNKFVGVGHLTSAEAGSGGACLIAGNIEDEFNIEKGEEKIIKKDEIVIKKKGGKEEMRDTTASNGGFEGMGVVGTCAGMQKVDFGEFEENTAESIAEADGGFMGEGLSDDEWRSVQSAQFLKAVSCMMARRAPCDEGTDNSSARTMEDPEGITDPRPVGYGAAEMFPTRRRPLLRAIDWSIPLSTVDEFFTGSDISLGKHLTADQTLKAKYLLFCWKDVFETDLLRIKRTDLIEHCIELLPRASPHKAKLPLYTESEMAFCDKLLP